MTEKTYIYHIVLPKVWKEVEDDELYEAESLSKEGFIHCSFAEQLEDVIDRYYGEDDTVVVLKIDPEKLEAKLVNEPSTNDEIYPHIYGKINRDAIVAFEYL